MVCRCIRYLQTIRAMEKPCSRSIRMNPTFDVKIRVPCSNERGSDLYALENASMGRQSPMRSLCRALGLALFYEAWHNTKGRKQSYETRKIAVREDRFIAGLAGTIHLLPASVAITIGLLNSVGYYIGEELAGPKGQDDEKLAGLQLAAKLHELTIQASIAAMLLQYVRHQLALSDGLPFGALFAGQLFKDISFLWSSEFWGTAKGFFPNRKRRLRLIVLLVVCALLGLTVGPASATIMKPRFGIWAAGGTDFWIDVRPQTLWSTNLTGAEVSSSCAVDASDRSCPHGDFQTLAQDYLPYWSHLEQKGYLPGTVRIPGFNSVRELYPHIRSSSQQFAQPFTVATTQYSAVADAVAETGRLWAWVVAAAWRSKGQPWRFWSHTEATFSVSAHQPIVHTRCHNNTTPLTRLNDKTVKFYDLSDIKTFQRTGDFPFVTVQTPALNDTFGALSSHGIRWLTINQPYARRTTLAALVSIPDISANHSEVYPCTIDARVAPASIQGTRNTYKVVTSHIHPSTRWMPAGKDATYGAHNSWPVIDVDPRWATYLNPFVGSGNSTAFRLMATSAGLYNTQALRNPDRGYAIESILSLMMANGLGRTNFGHGIVGDLEGWDFESDLPTCGDWCNQMMPLHGPMGNGGSIFTLNSTAKMNATMLTMHAKVSGYAYSRVGFTTILSIVVLFTYSCIVLTHWAYMIWVKESSSSWQSGAEIAALAMNSRPTDALQNTGAGVETSRVFGHQVRIVSVGERVELSFKGRPDEEDISLNAWYG